ncbi:hypothetical protein [Leucobacter chromiiresistens]|nr:hypothetical protein [Leucobacter chromiiresistens]
MGAEIEPADVMTAFGFRVHSTASNRLHAVRDDHHFDMRIFRMNRVPSPSKIRALRDTVDPGEIVTFVVPKATARAQEVVADIPGVGLVSGDGLIFLPGLTLIDTIEPLPKPRGRVPWGTYAVIRALIRTKQGRSQSALARETGLTQGAVSMALSKIAAEHHRDVDGWSTISPSELWDEFMETYPGPGGTRTFWYSMAPFNEQVRVLRKRALLSADGAADLIAPWRTPVKIVAYAAEGVSLEKLGFSPATREESNVEFVIPADRTIFATAESWGLGCADPVLAAWDVLQIGGNDAEEALEIIRRTVLKRWGT